MKLHQSTSNHNQSSSEKSSRHWILENRGDEGQPTEKKSILNDR